MYIGSQSNILGLFHVLAELGALPAPLGLLDGRGLMDSLTFNHMASTSLLTEALLAVRTLGHLRKGLCFFLLRSADGFAEGGAGSSPIARGAGCGLCSHCLGFNFATQALSNTSRRVLLGADSRVHSQSGREEGAVAVSTGFQRLWLQLLQSMWVVLQVEVVAGVLLTIVLETRSWKTSFRRANGTGGALLAWTLMNLARAVECGAGPIMHDQSLRKEAAVTELALSFSDLIRTDDGVMGCSGGLDGIPQVLALESPDAVAGVLVILNLGGHAS